MCGIAGVVGLEHREQRASIVAQMTAAIAHRGPDGEGFFHRDGVSLGHRRLSIIDPASGQQPLCNEDESIWLTYNGEIYNFQELRNELRGHGHVFRTQCDSEVIVHAYEQWGPACVERFRGMFAFGLVDFTQRRVLLARDQLGIKPLYYRHDCGFLAFASELPALVQACPQPPTISPRAIEFFLRYRYVPAPDTGYEHVWKLPPGTYQIHDLSGGLIEQREYWKFAFRSPSKLSADEWLEAFEAELMESVQSHLVSDVPFGAFLSGGVDSTLVVMCMSRLLNRNVTAFTIGFDESGYSELDYARQAAERLGITLQSEIVRPDVVSTLEQLFTNYGEPFADTSAVPTWCVSELARRHVPMVLSGDGADEAFAGYQRYGWWLDDSLLADLKTFHRYPKRLLRRLAAGWRSSAADHQWQQRFVGLLDRPTRGRLWRPEFHGLLDCDCPAFDRATANDDALHKLSLAQTIDIKTYLPGDILTKVDIASMQHGLEVRTPFTDVKMLEFAASLPIEQRCDRDKKGARVLKVLPKKLLSQKFSPGFVNRPKMGFAIPEVDWMTRGNPVRGCFEDLLAGDARIFDFIQRDALATMVRDFDARRTYAAPLWSIFSLAFWLDRQASVTRNKLAA